MLGAIVIQLKELVGYCSGKEGSSMEFPFGKLPICFKFKGRIFAEIYPNEDDYKLTLRCSPEMGECFREAFKVNVVPAYHVPERQRRHKFTVLLKGSIKDGTIYSMIDHSYSTLED
jgi:predicted DNA-binding protein (MmcQ/YjbR family)